MAQPVYSQVGAADAEVVCLQHRLRVNSSPVAASIPEGHSGWANDIDAFRDRAYAAVELSLGSVHNYLFPIESVRRLDRAEAHIIVHSSLAGRGRSPCQTAIVHLLLRLGLNSGFRYLPGAERRLQRGHRYWRVPKLSSMRGVETFTINRHQTRARRPVSTSCGPEPRNR